MSFCIAAIGNDGIIIATESRGNLYDKNNGNPFCYYDTIQKTFTDGKIGIGSTGEGVIGGINGIFFSKIIEDYFSRNLIYPKGGEIESFIKYIQIFLPNVIGDLIIKGQVLMFGAYIQNKPFIGYMDYRLLSNENQVFYDWEGNIKYLTSDNKCTFGEKYTSGMSCIELAKIATESIQEYGNRGDNYKTIGGPVSVLQITNTGTKWIQNPPIEQKYLYFSDFIDGYKNQEIDLKFIEDYDKKYLDKLLGI